MIRKDNVQAAISKGKIAIDVVLLPPDDVMDICIEVNKKIKDKLFVLKKDDFVPHNSLCIGVVEEKKLPDVFAALTKLKDKLKPVPITIKAIERAFGLRKSDGFNIEKNELLIKTHIMILTALKPLLEFQSGDLTILFRKKGETVSTIPRVLQDGYLNFSLDNYHPHITLGGKGAQWDYFPINCLAHRLAVFHAGEHVTCRKLLFEMPLR